jgi:hypothetical protein
MLHLDYYVGGSVDSSNLLLLGSVLALIRNVPFVERSAAADRRTQRQRRQQLLEAARSRSPALSHPVHPLIRAIVPWIFHQPKGSGNPNFLEVEA